MINVAFAVAERHKACDVALPVGQHAFEARVQLRFPVSGDGNYQVLPAYAIRTCQSGANVDRARKRQHLRVD